MGVVTKPIGAQAHAFAAPYALPVPLGYYAWGAALALILSFIMVAALREAPASVLSPNQNDCAAADSTRATRRCGMVGLSLLSLCILTGLLGTPNAYVNFNMTFFWIFFVLGVPYAVAIVGDFYALFNPWRSLVRIIEVISGRPAVGIPRISARIGHAPALILYIAFVQVELFSHLGPRGLAIALLVYSAINVGGAFVMGREAWFRQGEFFSIVIHLLGRMSFRPDGWTRGAQWRSPFVGLLRNKPSPPGVLLVILFMLSSTAFDGLHDTAPFSQFFFGTLYPWIEPWVPGDLRERLVASVRLYALWQWLVLVASPFLYLVAMRLASAAMKRLAGSLESEALLCRRFAASLVPIAFVYHTTHYYPLLFAQGSQLLRIVSDPFGFHWDLFGTARTTVAPLMIDAGLLWASQVGLIVAGHAASVYLAHVEALRLFANRRAAMASQLPMLLLMIAMTTFGLWILSLPLAPSLG